MQYTANGGPLLDKRVFNKMNAQGVDCLSRQGCSLFLLTARSKGEDSEKMSPPELSEPVFVDGKIVCDVIQTNEVIELDSCEIRMLSLSLLPLSV